MTVPILKQTPQNPITSYVQVLNVQLIHSENLVETLFVAYSMVRPGVPTT